MLLPPLSNLEVVGEPEPMFIEGVDTWVEVSVRKLRVNVNLKANPEPCILNPKPSTLKLNPKP